MSQTVTLQTWFSQQVATQGIAPRNTLVLLSSIKLLRLALLIAGYYFFASIMHQWVIDGARASVYNIAMFASLLLSTWLLQRVIINQTANAKQRLSVDLEQRMLVHFRAQQHALLRTQSPYFWQSMWSEHIPALANWRYDYQIQQIVAVLTPLLTLMVILPLNPVIGLSLLVTMPVVPLFMIIVGKGAAALHQKHFVALARLGSIFVDRMKALSMINSFGAHSQQRESLNRASKNVNDRTMKVVSIAFLSNSVLDFFSTVAVALVAVFIGFTLLGELDIGPQLQLQTGLWLLLAIPLLFSELKLLGQFYHQKAQAQAAKDIMGQWLLPKSAQQLPTSDALGTWHCEEVTLENGVKTEQPLSLNTGDKVLLRGPSGSGKTLLLEALAGLRNNPCILPCKVAMLTQQPVILPTTIRDNLTLGANISDDHLEYILAQVELSQWHQSQPYGLDTVMGTRAPVSGGQAQRLALARLLLQSATVWLLDEPTAHLTQEQHQRLSSLIYRVAGDRTVIWASHKSLSEFVFTQHWVLQQGSITCT